MKEPKWLLIFARYSNKLMPPLNILEGWHLGNGMIRKALGLLLICFTAFFIPGCGTGQQLVGITVNPATVVFGSPDPALFAQLTAMGSYTHPPATKDITNQVTWTSNIVEVAQVTSTGKVTPNVACGVTPINATMLTNSPRGNEITGTMSVTVDGTATGCPTATP